jgi:hypothetical protein
MPHLILAIVALVHLDASAAHFLFPASQYRHIGAFFTSFTLI